RSGFAGTRRALREQDKAGKHRRDQKRQQGPRLEPRDPACSIREEGAQEHEKKYSRKREHEKDDDQISEQTDEIALAPWAGCAPAQACRAMDATRAAWRAAFGECPPPS